MSDSESGDEEPNQNNQPPPVPMQQQLQLPTQFKNNMNVANVNDFMPFQSKPKGPTPLGKITSIKDPNMKKKAKDLEVASVVVTISTGESFDQLFRRIPQESEYGRVAVYLVSPGHMLHFIQRALEGDDVEKFTKPKTKQKLPPQQLQLLKDLKNDCEAAGSDAVCFNFECCGGYSQAGFCHGKKDYTGIYMDLIAFLVRDFGCMTMFSDFSLKALIKDWNVKKLGPNPFKQIGSFAGNMTIEFDPEQLKESPSAQLNTVGSLSQGGKAELHAMLGTILFTVSAEGNALVKETKAVLNDGGGDPMTNEYMTPYEIEVLSIATMCSLPAFTTNKVKEVDEDEGAATCEIGDKVGLAGHILLTFPPSDRSLEKFKAELKEQEVAREIAIQEKKAMNLEDEDQILPGRGMILASSGHWVELMKIDVNTKRLLETVRQDWGEEAENFQQMNRDMADMNASQRQMYSAQKAVEYVQSRPAAKFNKVLKRKKKNGY